MTEFIPGARHPNYKEVMTPRDQERALVSPHYQWDDRAHIVHPAGGSTLEHLVDPNTGGFQACLRLDHAYGPTSLMQVLSVDELRALAAGMTALADEMEADAARMLADALRKGARS